ncbi:MAG: LamG domain-containing protein [Bacteroidota bacterium]
MKRIIILLFGSFLFSSLIAQKINLEQDLVARYLFEGNARNEVEDSNHGIETNVQYATDRHGWPNQCLYLTGDNSFVTIPHTEDLNWDARTESYSILFWVKSNDPRHGRNGIRVLQKWNEIIANPYPFSFPCGDEALNSQIRLGSITLACTVSGIWDDQWHHAAMIYDKNQHQMSLYYDGVLIQTNSKQFPNTTKNNLDICIGKTLLLEEYYKGYVDDLYFYNRAIEACEVEALYSGQLLIER